MPTEGCSGCMPLPLLILRSGCLLGLCSIYDEGYTSHIPIKCGVGDPNVY